MWKIWLQFISYEYNLDDYENLLNLPLGALLLTSYHIIHDTMITCNTEYIHHNPYPEKYNNTKFDEYSTYTPISDPSLESITEWHPCSIQSTNTDIV